MTAAVTGRVMAAVTRWVAVLVAGVVLLCGLGLAAPSMAAAQPAPGDAPAAVERREIPRSATPAGKAHGDRDSKYGPAVAVDAQGKPYKKGQAPVAVLFWLFALMAVGGSLFVVTRRNLITAVMGMVGTFFAIAALYMMLYASFVAIIQMLVYAGAIMVLFVFVIMILNKPEDEPYGAPGKAGKILALVSISYLVFRVGQVLIDVSPPSAASFQKPPLTGEGYQWGSTASVGWNLFNDYLFPFEAVSILLLIAVVGAIAIARPLKDEVFDDGHLDTLGEPPAGGHS